MNWFGEPWPSPELRAPVCDDDALRVPPPPPGELCVLCNGTFVADAQGVMMPHLSEDIGWRKEFRYNWRYCHLGCLLGNVGGEGISWVESVEDGTEGGYTAYPAGSEEAMRDYHRRNRRGKP